MCKPFSNFNLYFSTALCPAWGSTLFVLLWPSIELSVTVTLLVTSVPISTFASLASLDSTTSADLVTRGLLSDAVLGCATSTCVSVPWFCVTFLGVKSTCLWFPLLSWGCVVSLTWGFSSSLTVSTFAGCAVCGSCTAFGASSVVTCVAFDGCSVTVALYDWVSSIVLTLVAVVWVSLTLLSVAEFPFSSTVVFCSDAAASLSCPIPTTIIVPKNTDAAPNLCFLMPYLRLFFTIISPFKCKIH